MSDLWIISIVLICLFLTNNSVLVLSFVPTTTLSYMVPPAFAVSTQLQFSDDKNTNNGISNINVTLEFTSRVGDIFPDGEILTIEMVDHQPLGCTVEESINEEDDYLFISKLADKGSAENAGFQVGDVVVQITGTFGKLTDVLGASVEKM
ncbi:MAG: putative metalloprotease with PDZ domain [Bacillariaceae sp.]|jgi:predicted metalloprotease with PDZ domain